MSTRRLSLAQKRAVDDLLALGASLGERIGVHALPEMVKLLRQRLGMTQRVLAKRAGMPQSYIGKVESGSVHPSLHTMDRIFEALGCRLALVPVPHEMPNEMIEQQVLKAAETMVDYVIGTMAMEDQRPDDEMRRELLEQEKRRLHQELPPSIWEIE